MFRSCIALLGLIPLGSSLAAQSNQADIDRQAFFNRRDSIVGLTGNFPAPKLVRTNMDTCANSFCTPGIQSTQTNHGGTAFDARLNGVWISSGTTFRCVDPYPCQSVCPEKPIPFGPATRPDWAGPVVGGLAMDHKRHILYVADVTNSALHRIWIGANCTFVQSESCDIRPNLPAGHLLGGLAIDNLNRNLFVGSYHPVTGAVNVYMTPLEVATTDTWCDKRCDLTTTGGVTFPDIEPSPTGVAGRLTGLAFDAARRILYATNGEYTVGLSFKNTITSPAVCHVEPVKFCRYVSSGTNDEYIGLAIMPPPVTSHGEACASAGCNSCSTMTAFVDGNASFNNTGFAIRLRNAPITAYPLAFGIGFGPCRNVGIDMGLCAPITMSMNQSVIIGLFVQAGVTPCSGRADVDLPVPPDIRLSGYTFSAQFGMLCEMLSGTGSAVSECLQFTVNGS